MPYSIEFTSAAVRELEKLPQNAKEKISARIDALATDPRPRNARKLHGGDNEYRIRVGDYRVIYQVFDSKLLIIVVRIGNRRDIYRR